MAAVPYAFECIVETQFSLFSRAAALSSVILRAKVYRPAVKNCQKGKFSQKFVTENGRLERKTLQKKEISEPLNFH